MFISRKPTLWLLTLVFVCLTTIILFCSKSGPTKPDNGNQTQDAIKTVQLEPGKADTVAFSDQFKIAFPAGSVSANKEIQAREVNVQANAELYASTELLSPAYILTPHGQVLQKPAHIEFDISQIQIPQGLTIDSLDIFTYNGQSFESQNARVESGKLVCELSHFSMIFVRMRTGLSLFGGSNILDTPLHVYKQQGYLCFGNVFGDITMNPIKAIWTLANSPVHLQIVYQASLYESPAIGFDKLVMAKQSCRITWDNPGESYEAYWSPGSFELDASFTSGDISYGHYPPTCFRLKESSSLDPYGKYGDETVINYDASQQKSGTAKQQTRRQFVSTDLTAAKFLSNVFISDDMRKFIPLLQLDENKEYCLKVEIHYSDWQFGSSNQRTSANFKLQDVPVEETPNQPPTAAISSPSNGASYTQGQNISFTGSGNDPEDGTLTGSSLVWTSDRDGQIGTGASFTKSNLSVGTHQITLTATDSKGLVGTTGIVMTITQAIQPVISVPSSLSFGSVTVGSSNDQVLTIQNTGTATLQVTGITFTDVQFTIVSIGTSFNIPAGGSHDVTVRFTPGTTGSQSGILRISNNSSVNPKEVNLSGAGTTAAAPVISVPASLDFGSITLGGSSNKVLTIQNTGNAVLQVTGITFTDAQFTLFSGGTSFNVSSGGSQNVTVRFTPSSAGNKTGILRISNNSSVNPKEVNLNGTGDSSPSGETGTMTDQDGNVYRTIKIGNQWWMAENLKVTHYRNGDLIPNVIDDTEWSNLTTGARCAYDNDENNVATYGRLYNWYTVNDSRHIAPAGWHVPSMDAEWQTIVDYLGGSVAGGKMKETGTAHWKSPNTGATNESGFSALPGGHRYYDGEFYDMGYYAYFWSSSEVSTYYAWFRFLYYASSDVDRGDYDKQDGFSVRLVRD
jgi:uncharacterized protein (TIGR02145 family)